MVEAWPMQWHHSISGCPPHWAAFTQGRASPPQPHSTNCSPWTSSLGIICELVRYAEYQSPPQTCRIRMYILTRFLGDSCAHWSLRSPVPPHAASHNLARSNTFPDSPLPRINSKLLSHFISHQPLLLLAFYRTSCCCFENSISPQTSVPLHTLWPLLSMPFAYCFT